MPSSSDQFMQLVIKFALMGEENAVKALKLLEDEKKAAADLTRAEAEGSKKSTDQQISDLERLRAERDRLRAEREAATTEWEKNNAGAGAAAQPTGVPGARERNAARAAENLAEYEAALARTTGAEKTFTISTEAEYVAVAKAHEAIRARLSVMGAAGKATEDLALAQRNLSAALSTDRALEIARNLEGKQALQTSLERIAAEERAAAALRKTTAATRELHGAAGVTSTAMREFTVIGRELANGNFSRLPGSVSILASQFGLLGSLLNPVTIGIAGVGAVFYMLYSHIERVNEETNAMLAHWQDLTDLLGDGEAIRAQNDVFSDLAGKVEASAEATYDLAGASETLKKSTDDANTASSQAARLADEERRAQENLAIAKIRVKEATKELTHEQAAQAERDVRGQFSTAANSAANFSEAAAITALKNERTKQQGILDQTGNDQTARAGTAGYFADLAAEKKKLSDAAAKDVKSQQDWLQKNGASLSPDDFAKEWAKLFQLQQRQIQAEDAYTSAAQKAADEKKKSADLDKEHRAAQERLNQLDQQITAKESEHAALAEHRRTMAQTQTEIDSAQNQADRAKAAGADLTRGGRIADKLRAGGGVSPDDAQFLIVLEQAITGRKQTLETAVRLISAQLGSQETSTRILAAHAEQIATVQRRLDELDSRGGTSKL